MYAIHAMGFSLKPENYEAFKTAFCSKVERGGNEVTALIIDNTDGTMAIGFELVKPDMNMVRAIAFALAPCTVLDTAMTIPKGIFEYHGAH